jgi:hypothetical protein
MSAAARLRRRLATSLSATQHRSTVPPAGRSGDRATSSTWSIRSNSRFVLAATLATRIARPTSATRQRPPHLSSGVVTETTQRRNGARREGNDRARPTPVGARKVSTPPSAQTAAAMRFSASRRISLGLSTATPASQSAAAGRSFVFGLWSLVFARSVNRGAVVSRQSPLSRILLGERGWDRALPLEPSGNAAPWPPCRNRKPAVRYISVTSY